MLFVSDNLDQLDARSFFEQYYSHIFYVFYENFVAIETILKQRVHKAQREELDGIVAIFEVRNTFLYYAKHFNTECGVFRFIYLLFSCFIC